MKILSTILNTVANWFLPKYVIETESNGFDKIHFTVKYCAPLLTFSYDQWLVYDKYSQSIDTRIGYATQFSSKERALVAIDAHKKKLNDKQIVEIVR
jgi:hypothetical protein